MSKHIIGVSALLVILVSLSCAPSPHAAPDAQATSGVAQPSQGMPQHILVVAVRGEPPSLASRPVVPFSGSLQRPRELFNAQLDFRDENGKPQAQLAQALPQLNTATWTVNPDGTMETIYRLKPNLVWHDGEPLTAEDFVFAWRVYSTPAMGTAATPPVGQMQEVTAPDPRTVVFHWKQLYPDAASMDRDFQALPEHILGDQFQSDDATAFTGLPFWSSEYVGLGPYRLTNWVPGSYLEGTAFDSYALGRPKIDQIKVLFIDNPQTALASLMAGDIHLIADPLLSASDGQALEQGWTADQRGVVLYSPVGLRTGLVQMRPDAVDSPALLDARVRKAIRFGMDPVAAVDALTGGKGIVTRTITSPNVDFYPQIEGAIEPYSYDPQQARQLMETAGYTTGSDGLFVDSGGNPVHLSVASSSGDREEMEAGVYADGLKRAGFNVSQVVVPVQQLRDPQTRALLSGLQIRGGADRHVSYQSTQIPSPENRWTGDNRGGWSNPDYDRTYQRYIATLDPTQRIQQLAQLERLISQDAAVIPLMFNVYVVAHIATLSGPVARQTPRAGDTFLHIEQWAWTS